MQNNVHLDKQTLQLSKWLSPCTVYSTYVLPGQELPQYLPVSATKAIDTCLFWLSVKMQQSARDKSRSH